MANQFELLSKDGNSIPKSALINKDECDIAKKTALFGVWCSIKVQPGSLLPKCASGVSLVIFNQQQHYV